MIRYNELPIHNGPRRGKKSTLDIVGLRPKCGSALDQKRHCTSLAAKLEQVISSDVGFKQCTKGGSEGTGKLVITQPGRLLCCGGWEESKSVNQVPQFLLILRLALGHVLASVLTVPTVRWNVNAGSLEANAVSAKPAHLRIRPSGHCHLIIAYKYSTLFKVSMRKYMPLRTMNHPPAKNIAASV